MRVFIPKTLCPALLVTCLLGSAGHAATLVVDSSADDHDARPGDDRCASTAGGCTLRAAIEEANATRGADTIIFRLSAGSSIVLKNGQLTIGNADKLMIEGPGSAGLAVDGDGVTRLFRVDAGTTVELAGLTLRHGFAVEDHLGNRGFGGGVENFGALTLRSVVVSDNGAAAGGGGIMNSGMLSLIDSTVKGNRAAEFAGGLLNAGTLDLVDSIVSDNDAPAGGGGIDNRDMATLTGTTVSDNSSADHAAGIENRGTLTLANSTVSANRGLGGAGGIENFGTLNLFDSTVSGNRSNFGGGIDGAGGEIIVANSLIAGNLGPTGPADPSADCNLSPLGTLDSRGYNLFGQDTGCRPGARDLTIDPSAVAGFLGPLQDNGGPTPTQALLVVPGNPAIGGGNPAACTDPQGIPLAIGQGGRSRSGPTGRGCDLGADELRPTLPFAGFPSRSEGQPDQPAGGEAVAAVTTTVAAGVSCVGRVASFTSATSSTRAILTADRQVAAGDALLVAVLLSSTTSFTGAVSATDGAGNLYTIDRDQNDAAAKDRVIVLSALSVKSLPVGGTITLTYPSSAECHISVDEFAGPVALDKTASTWGTNSTFDSGPATMTSQPVELLFGVVGSESGVSATWSSSWTALPTLSVNKDHLGTAYRTSSSTGQFAASGLITGTWMAAIVTFTAGPPPESAPTATLSVTNLSSPALTVLADASGSTDIDATPIASYRFDFGDGTPAVTILPPTSTAQHTYAAAGTYLVTLMVTDTGGNTSAPATASISVTASTPDSAPIARLSVTIASSPALTVTADASRSTDIDATPIADYRFDFGDGTPAVTLSPPVATCAHTYAVAGTYLVTLTVTDTGSNMSAPATASVGVSSTAPAIAIYVGYYDTHHHYDLEPKPNPWRGSPGVVFAGQSDADGGWDTSAVRVDNLSGASLAGVVVTVDIGSNHFALWGTQTIPSGGVLIIAQTSKENFDGSDTNSAGCYSCSPTKCTSEVSSTIPVVHVTIGGKTTNYFDTGQVLNTHGVDSAGCPYTGTRNDESEDWRRIAN